MNRSRIFTVVTNRHETNLLIVADMEGSDKNGLGLTEPV